MKLMLNFFTLMSICFSLAAEKINNETKKHNPISARKDSRFSPFDDDESAEEDDDEIIARSNRFQINDNAKGQIKDKGKLYYKGSHIKWCADANMHLNIGETSPLCVDLDECNDCNDCIDCCSKSCCDCIPKPSCEAYCYEDLCGCMSYEYPLVCGHMFLTGEFLYWKPKVPILWGTVSENLGKTQPDLNGVFSNRKDGIVNMQGHAGYRIEVGFYLPPNAWTTSIRYTQFYSSGNDFLTENGDAINFGLAIPYESLAPASSLGPEEASADQRIRLKLLDWTLQKSIFWCNRFNLNPFFGLRYGWIYNDMTILVSAPNTTTGAIGFNEIDLNNHYRAFGLITGLKMNWLLGCGFEIFGNFTLSGLWGKYDLRNKQSGLRANNAGIVPFKFTTHNKLYTGKPIFEFLFGLNWGRRFYCNKLYFGMKAGYEISVYPSQIQLARASLSAVSDPVDQTIHGLTLASSLHF